MSPDAKQTLEKLKHFQRPASIATLGWFRPPEDPITSWFGRGVGLPTEETPMWQGNPLFPLLQIRMSELPYVPEALQSLELLVLFFPMGGRNYPFDKPHGEGWLIREYQSLEGLVPLPEIPAPYNPLPIRWSRVEDDTPGWEDAWDLLDLSAVNDDDEASQLFYDFSTYPQTKLGSYPFEVQHGVGLENFVFQVGSEEKARWQWVDRGIAYFFRTPEGEWRWDCQFL
jgi:hypothetical protein